MGVCVCVCVCLGEWIGEGGGFWYTTSPLEILCGFVSSPLVSSRKLLSIREKKKEENSQFHRMINCLVDLSLVEQCNN